jgi:predicted DCC family thiol-disulfide oxidoreductase YuxK
MNVSAMTGAQYSVVRVVSGLLLAGVFVRAPAPFAPLGLALTVLFCVGFLHRAAAVGLALLVAATTSGAPSEARLLTLLALALHASLPPKPYGTLAMRGDPDPGSSWRLPRAALIPLWGGLIVTLALQVHPALAVLVLPALMPRMRTVAWLGLLLAGVGHMLMVKTLDDAPGYWMALMLTLEPQFVKPLDAKEGDLIFYDGACGLCHGFVRFVLSEDPHSVFRFAPLQSETFAARVPEELRKTLPDSVIVSTADGRLLSRSEGMIYVLLRLGGLWGLVARVARVAPRGLRDAVYDQIAAVRHRLFKKPADACPLMPKELRVRFLY